MLSFKDMKRAKDFMNIQKGEPPTHVHMVTLHFNKNTYFSTACVVIVSAEQAEVCEGEKFVFL